MHDAITDSQTDTVVAINPTGQSPVLLVCEHASCHIPTAMKALGVSGAARNSHIAWDPGALAVARAMSSHFDAVLIASTVSRLVYDCNRPPDAPDAIPVESERHSVPGNVGLTAAERAERVARFYAPFRASVASALRATAEPILVTVHSFTPVYAGTSRSVEIGVLHDRDARLADAMLACARDHTEADVRRNEPYGPEDGVTHTLTEHALPAGCPNVMLEIRNDLIADAPSQCAMARMLARWLTEACTHLESGRALTCSA